MAARVRVKRVVAPSLGAIESAVNREIARLEAQDRPILSVQFEFPPDPSRECSAFLLYEDRAGAQEARDHAEAEAQDERLAKMRRRVAEREPRSLAVREQDPHERGR